MKIYGLFQIEGDTFKNRTYVDEVEWVAFKYRTGLPAWGIILSPVWVIQSEKYWISLEGNINPSLSRAIISLFIY